MTQHQGEAASDSSLVTRHSSLLEHLGGFISMSEARELIPSAQAGKRLARSTLRRWIKDGRLKTVKRGGRRFTRVEWVLLLFEEDGGQELEVRGQRSEVGRQHSVAEEIAAAEEQARWADGVLRRAGIKR